MEDFLQEKAHLRIKATTEGELKIISACVQDALVPLSGLHFDKDHQSFKLLLNRFQWEKEPVLSPGETMYMRTHTCLTFDDVTHVDYRGLDANHSLKMLNILMLYVKNPDFVYILCSEGVIIRLHSASISCYLEDINDPWPTQQKPDHLPHVA